MDQELEALIRKLEAELIGLTGMQRDAAEAYINALRKAQRGSLSLSNNLDSASQSSETFADRLDDGSDSVSVFSRALNKGKIDYEKAFTAVTSNMGKFFDRTFDKISELGTGSSESSGSIKSAAEMSAKAIGLLTDGIGSIVKNIPVIGGLLDASMQLVKGAAEAGSAAVGFWSGQMEGLRQQQKSFFNAGVQFSQGIDEAANIIQNSGFITLGDLAKAAEEARDSLRLMAGGSAGGLKRITSGFRAMAPEQREFLYALGYSNDEIMTGMADYAANVEKYGKALNEKELGQQSYAYLKNLRELERLTGVSIRDQKQQQEANNRNLYIQNQLASLQGKQRGQTEQFLTTIPPMLQDVALSGQGMTRESAILAERLPTYAQGIFDITNRLKSGAIDAKDATAEYQALMKNPQLIAEMRQNQMDLGQAPAEMYGALSGIVQTIGDLQAQLLGNIKQAEQATPDPEKMKGNLQTGINLFVTESAVLASTMQSLSLQMSSGMSGAISAVIKGFREMAKTFGVELDVFANEISPIETGRNTALQKPMSEELTAEQKERLSITGFTTDWINLNTTIEKAQVKYTQEMIDSAKKMGISVDDYWKRMLQQETQGLSIITDYSNVRDEAIKVLENYNKAFPDRDLKKLETTRNMGTTTEQQNAARALNSFITRLDDFDPEKLAQAGLKEEINYLGLARNSYEILDDISRSVKETTGAVQESNQQLQPLRDIDNSVRETTGAVQDNNQQLQQLNDTSSQTAANVIEDKNVTVTQGTNLEPVTEPVQDEVSSYIIDMLKLQQADSDLFKKVTSFEASKRAEIYDDLVKAQGQPANAQELADLQEKVVYTATQETIRQFIKQLVAGEYIRPSEPVTPTPPSNPANAAPAEQSTAVPTQPENAVPAGAPLNPKLDRKTENELDKVQRNISELALFQFDPDLYKKFNEYKISREKEIYDKQLAEYGDRSFIIQDEVRLEALSDTLTEFRQQLLALPDNIYSETLKNPTSQLNQPAKNTNDIKSGASSDIQDLTDATDRINSTVASLKPTTATTDINDSTNRFNATLAAASINQSTGMQDIAGATDRLSSTIVATSSAKPIEKTTVSIANLDKLDYLKASVDDTRKEIADKSIQSYTNSNQNFKNLLDVTAAGNSQLIAMNSKMDELTRRFAELVSAQRDLVRLAS